MRERFAVAVFSVAVAFGFAACSSGGSSPVSLPAAPSNGVPRSDLSGSAGAGNGVVYGVHPVLHYLGPNVHASNCAPGTVSCLTPATIYSGYDFPSQYNGTGQTIVIVDAFGSPTITSDLKTFDQQTGLPDPPSFNIVYPGGVPTFNPTKSNQVDFAEETNLDVEWAHAAAPGANIVLVVAANDSGNVLNSAQLYAVQNHLGSVMSLSFGVQEELMIANSQQLMQAEQIYLAAKAAGITVIASDGDLGAGGGYSVANAEFPASDPYVLAVGGTNLSLTAGAYQGETVWNDFDNCISPCLQGADGATGGAPSIIFPAPSYQQGVTNNSMRTVSDVAYNASPNTGVAVYVGFAAQVKGLGPNGFYVVGGTSQGPPQWAGIIATANQARVANGMSTLGFVNPLLYKVAANGSLGLGFSLHDVTSGDNHFPKASSPGFSAGPGYDLPTGLGSPDVAKFVYAVAPCFTGSNTGGSPGTCTLNPDGSITLNTTAPGSYAGVYLTSKIPPGLTLSGITTLSLTLAANNGSTPNQGSPRVSIPVNYNGSDAVFEYINVCATPNTLPANLNINFLSTVTCANLGNVYDSDWNDFIGTYGAVAVTGVPFFVADQPGVWTISNIQFGTGSQAVPQLRVRRP
jgi:subtilase family serine protease